jgi:hypothetical protein
MLFKALRIFAQTQMPFTGMSIAFAFEITLLIQIEEFPYQLLNIANFVHAFSQNAI